MEAEAWLFWFWIGIIAYVVINILISIRETKIEFCDDVGFILLFPLSPIIFILAFIAFVGGLTFWFTLYLCTLIVFVSTGIILLAISINSIKGEDSKYIYSGGESGHWERTYHYDKNGNLIGYSEKYVRD
jgi:hypothetical protein